MDYKLQYLLEKLEDIGYLDFDEDNCFRSTYEWRTKRKEKIRDEEEKKLEIKIREYADAHGMGDKSIYELQKIAEEEREKLRRSNEEMERRLEKEREEKLANFKDQLYRTYDTSFYTPSGCYRH